jgi:predicted signal transduction protein with EAL and GGDEF domain
MFTRYSRTAADHFEPEVDAATQRSLRGLLEKIDYTAFASNKEVFGAVVGAVEEARIQRLAVAAAQARASWINAALKLADHGRAITPDEAEKLLAGRAVYEELAAAYEALRRAAERGYVKVAVAAKAPEKKAG